MYKKIRQLIKQLFSPPYVEYVKLDKLPAWQKEMYLQYLGEKEAKHDQG